MASITVTKKKQKQKIKEPQIKITWKEIKRQKVLLIWSAIIVVYGVIFCYLPLGGWLMAFQNYKPKDGLLHSSFVGLAKFQQLFSDATFLRVIRCDQSGRHLCDGDRICNFIERGKITGRKKGRTDHFLSAAFPFLDYCYRYFT